MMEVRNSNFLLVGVPFQQKSWYVVMKKTFKDDLQIYVFTTRFVMKNNSPITFITHDENGDWQFMSDDDFEEDDAMVVSLEEMIEHDSSISEVADLPYEGKAYRENADLPWEIVK